jgi:hypothetical protein
MDSYILHRSVVSKKEVFSFKILAAVLTWEHHARRSVQQRNCANKKKPASWLLISLCLIPKFAFWFCMLLSYSELCVFYTEWKRVGEYTSICLHVPSVNLLNEFL